MSDETRSNLLNGKPKFISLVIGDGEEIIVQTDNINHMCRLFEKPIGSNKPVNERR
jgi:hypothetical protein